MKIIISVFRNVHFALFLTVFSGTLAFSQDEYLNCAQNKFRKYARSIEAFADHKNSLIKIKAGSEKGTGFLIDKEKGLVLTAYHVIESANPTKNNPNEIIAIGIPEEDKSLEVKLSFVDGDISEDIAVLKIEDPHPIWSVKPFEIAAGRLNVSEEYTYGGYKAYQIDEKIPSLGIVSGNIALHTTQGGKHLFRILGTVFDGFSGAPVVNDRGLVVGIVLQKESTQDARVLPSNSFLPVLQRLKTTELEQEFYDGFLSPDLKEFKDRFTKRLNPSSENSVSNLNLIHFLLKVRDEFKSRSEFPYDHLRTAIDCQLFPTAWDRELEEPAKSIAYLVVPSTVTREVKGRIGAARELHLAGLQDKARQEWESMKILLTSGFETYGKNEPDKLSNALCSAGEDPRASASEIVRAQLIEFELPADTIPPRYLSNFLECQQITKDDDLGELLNIHAQVRQALDILNPGSGLPHPRALVWNMKFNYNESVEKELEVSAKVSTGILHSKNIELLGDVALAKGDYVKATQAYALSNRLKGITQSLTYKFDWALAQSSIPRDSYRAYIATAPSLILRY